MVDADRTPTALTGSLVDRSRRSGAQVWWAYAKLTVRGRRYRRPTEDTMQLGGDFVVGRDGRIAYSFPPDDPDDRPPVDELIAAVRSA